MMKLASVAAVGLAVVAMGCQAQAPVPPQTPQGGAMNAPPPPPPSPPYGGEPGMMAHHEECPGCPWAHRGGGEAWEHHGRPEHREGGGMRDWMRRGPGQGHMGAGGGREVMRELAALGVHFYPPPMLIRRAQKIGLTPDQVTKIRQEMLGTRAHAVDLLAKIEHARIEAIRLLSADKIDEHAADAQVDEAAKAEAELHKLHLGAMLRVRALLTPEQRQKLEEHKPGHESPKAGASAAGQTSSAIGEADDDDDDDDDDDGDADG